MSKEAMKLALEALEAGEYYIDDLEAIVYAADDLGTHEDRAKMQEAITALREALAEQPAQQALDKMAENARELGIQMQPEEPRAWFTVDELNAWADKKLKENPQWAEQPAQQEPVAWMTKDGEIYKHECWPEYEARPLVFGDTTTPAQRKPLTDMQVDGEWILVRDLDTNDVEKSRLFARAIEAAHGIKEKNT